MRFFEVRFVSLSVFKFIGFRLFSWGIKKKLNFKKVYDYNGE